MFVLERLLPQRFHLNKTSKRTRELLPREFKHLALEQRKLDARPLRQFGVKLLQGVSKASHSSKLTCTISFWFCQSQNLFF